MRLTGGVQDGQITYDAHIVNDDLDRASDELDAILTERLQKTTI